MAGLVITSLGDSDETAAVGLVVAVGSIAVLLTLLGFVAGWFGRERDDVVVTAIGAAIVVAVALGVASVMQAVEGSRIRLRLPYGRRGVGSGAGGPEVIRAWLTARPTVVR